MKSKDDIKDAVNTIKDMLASEKDDLEQLEDYLVDIECTGDCFGCAAHHVYRDFENYHESCNYTSMTKRADIIRKKIKALKMAKKSLERALAE